MLEIELEPDFELQAKIMASFPKCSPEEWSVLMSGDELMDLGYRLSGETET